MPSLPRTGKRARTHQRILEEAIRLFRKDGVRATRLSRVATESDVSPATLFNHFPTKGTLAEVWVRGEVLDVLGQTIEATVSEGRSLRSALRVASRELAERSCEEPEIRLEAWCEAGRASSFAIDEDPRLTLGLEEEQKREHVRGDLEARVLASMLVDAIEGGLIEGLRRLAESASIPAGSSSAEEQTKVLAAAIRDRLDLVLDGTRKRNERVRPPTRSA